MKRVALLLAVITAAFTALFSSCEKATVLSTDQQLVTFSEAGGSQIISLTANKPWTASSDQGWCKVTPSAGEDATNSRVSINCDPNTTYDTRYCNITFTCAELTKTVSVTQEESEGMLISPTDYDISNEAQQINIEVKANVKFTVAVDDVCKSWIRHSATKGLTTSTVVLDISKNEDYDGREGRVIISQTDGSLFSTIKIRQSQNNGLFITTSEYELSNESHQLSVEVKSNINFEVSSGASWIKYVETKSLNTSFIVLDIEANQDYDKREGKVIVKQKGGGLEGTITIKQDQNYGLLISQVEYDLSNAAQTINVEIKHNVDFDVVIPADCKGWISKIGTKGLETSTMTFLIAKNDTYDSREGSITFKQKNGPLSGTVKVLQAQTDGIQVEKEVYSIDHKGGTVEVNVKANVDYETTIDEAAKNWMSVVKTKAMDPSKITLSVTANESEQPRGGKVYVRQANGSAETSFTVTQTGKNTIAAAFHDFAASSVGDQFDIDVESTVEIEVVIPKDATWLTQLTTKAATTNTLSFQVATNKTTKARVATVQFVNKIEGLSDTVRIEQNAVNVPISNELIYTSTDEAIVTPYQADAFGSKIISNTVVDGKGSIRFEKPLEFVGEKAFYNRINLKSVFLPEGLKVVSDYAFDNCIRLETITLPSSLHELKSYAFKNCQKLTRLELPSGIEYVSQGLFYGCKSLEEIALPSTISSIYSEAFRECESLAELVLPSNLGGSIHQYTFYGCSKLKKMSIPEGVYSLEHYAFQYCTSLSDISISEGLERIEWDCFWGCSNLKKVKLPNSLTYISSSVFRECKSLATIDIPAGVTFIGNSCFRGCSNLVSISFPDGISTLESDMFHDCSALVYVNLPEQITKIGYGAFQNCTSLKSFTVPNGVKILEDSSFNGCTDLEAIMIPPTVTTIENSVFENSGLTEITIPNSVSELQNRVFFDCEKLKSVVLSSSLTSIPQSAFQNCVKLEKVELPASIKVLENAAFYHSGVKTIKLNNGLEELKDQVFDLCEQLTSIIVPNSVTKIGYRTFCNCKALTTATLPDGLAEIREGLFYYCSSLKDISIPSNVTIIGQDAFAGCNSLKTISIPKGVTSIGYNAFHSCWGLASVTLYPTVPPTCENGPFYNTNECPIYVPKASVDTYKNTGYWKEYVNRIQAIP